MREIGDQIAQGTAMMTDTTVTSRVLGSAWPQHFNRPVAEAAYENIKQVGLPQWGDDDQKLAKALQRELKSREQGLATQLDDLSDLFPTSSETAAVPTTSATFHGTCRRSPCVTRRTFRDCRV